MEFHWPGYQCMGPGTHLEKRLARGDPVINLLDRIAKAHDIDYSKAKDLKDKWAADRKMIAKIDQLSGLKTLTERIVKNIMKAKLKLGMSDCIKKSPSCLTPQWKDTLLCTNMFNGFFFTNTGPFSPTRCHATLAVSSAGSDSAQSCGNHGRERDGPDARLTSSTFCVALTRHASHRKSSDALSIPSRGAASSKISVPKSNQLNHESWQVFLIIKATARLTIYTFSAKAVTKTLTPSA